MAESNLHETLTSIQRSVTRTETLMETLVAPGGRIPTLEAEVDELKAYKVKASTTVTIYSALVAGLGFLGHLAMDVLRGKH